MTSGASAPAPALPRRVLVTGASRGIGNAIARALLRVGVRLAVVGRDRKALAALLGDASGHALLEVDLARTAEVEASVDRAADMLGGLDAFVACAGIAEHAAVGGIGADMLARQFDVNFTAAFLMAQRAARPIEAAGGGSILLIASSLGIKPAPQTAAYAASKAALISMTHSFALELGPRGIRVNAIAPGVVDTDMVRREPPSPPGAEHGDGAAQKRIEERLETLRRLHPLGRLGHAEDVAETALYLLRAPYITGTVVAVDGGLLLGTGDP
jgi:NAD(P)-dependent dehydrogenase (short-subunit alcohol dehydrogenase family)